MSETPEAISWHCRGVLFENCNCQVVCPGHFHFSQLCTHERCIGYWGIEVDKGDFSGISLDGVKAVIVFDTPQNMMSGNWILTTYINEDVSPAQQAAMEKILSGEANGPWKILAKFVSERKETRKAAITFASESKTRSVTVGNFLRSTLTWLKGHDRDSPVMLVNAINQIHNSSQILSMGSTQYVDGPFAIATTNTHGLESSFSWTGSC